VGRILIIDDNEKLAGAYETSLTAAGFKVLKSFNGWDALGKIRNEKFDLVVTDLRMPKMSGIDLIESLRKEELETQHKTPIIISSGFIDEMVYEKFSTIGRIHFLPKPVMGRDLVAKVKGVLNIPTKKVSIDVNFLNSMISAVTNTIMQITGESLAVGNPMLKKPSETSGDISGTVSVLSSSFRGSVALSFQSESFIKLISKFLNIEFKTINEENKDSIIELLNVIFSSAKAEMVKLGTEIVAAVPTVITGQGHSVDHKQNSPTFTIQFKGKNFGECRLEVCSVN
jgi:chemotaxis protein CheX